MKLIVDTCVWWLALRRRDSSKLSAADRQMVSQLTEAIRDRKAVLLGPIRQEILSGIRDARQFAKARDHLEPFLNEPILGEDYVEAARLYNVCRSRGVECGPIDMQVCAVATRLRFDILTSDGGLKRCMETVREAGTLS